MAYDRAHSCSRKACLVQHQLMYLMVPAHQNLLSLLAHNFMASPLDQSCDRRIPPVPSNIWTPLDTDILELSTFCWFGADTLSVVLTLLQEGKNLPGHYTSPVSFCRALSCEAQEVSVGLASLEEARGVLGNLIDKKVVLDLIVQWMHS